MKNFSNKDFENYEDEAQEKWGQTNAYRQYDIKTKKYSKEKWNELNEGMFSIFEKFAI